MFREHFLTSGCLLPDKVDVNRLFHFFAVMDGEFQGLEWTGMERKRRRIYGIFIDRCYHSTYYPGYEIL